MKKVEAGDDILMEERDSRGVIRTLQGSPLVTQPAKQLPQNSPTLGWYQWWDDIYLRFGITVSCSRPSKLMLMVSSLIWQYV